MRRLGNKSARAWGGLGGIPLQRVNGEDTRAIIRAMQERGANVIDTARGYTVSEKLIGEALRDCRDNFFIFTKSSARSYSEMSRDIKLRLDNLATDYIDLYQFHNVKNLDEYNVIMGENGLPGLLEAKERGQIGHIGL